MEVSEADAVGVAPPEQSTDDRPDAIDTEAEERRFQGEEETLLLDGQGPQHRRVAALLNDLAKTARSFLLYDPRNNAIHNFLSELLANFKVSLEEYGDIHVDVQPFEMWYEGACVYLNRDRERSMSFRLYRDGVREMTFQPGFDWEEMAKLLEILSIRYTGVHQNEDDTVTLLWKANFQCLQIEAVEGYVPDDDEVVETRGPGRASADGPTMTPEVDLPAPRLGESAEVEWVDIPPEALDAIQREVGSGSLADECQQLIGHLSRLIDAPSEKLKLGDVSHIYQEVLSFFLSEEYLPNLVWLLGELNRISETKPPEWDGARPQLAQSLARVGGEVGSVRRVLRSVSGDGERASESLVSYLDAACADPLDVVTQVMTSERSKTVRTVGRHLLEHYAKASPARLQLRFKGASGHLAIDILRAVAHVGGDDCADWIARQTSHADRGVQEEAMLLLGALTYTGGVGKALSSTYKSSETSMRLKLLPILAATGDPRFVSLIEGLILERGGKISVDEAMKMGEVMGALGKKGGRARWTEWITPTGWFRKSLHGTPAQQVAAASALSGIADEAIADTLRVAMKAAVPEVSPFLGRCLMRHQQTMKRGAAQ